MKLFFCITSLLYLLVGVNMVIGAPNHLLAARSAQDDQEISDCKAACAPFKDAMQTFSDNVDVDGWEQVKKLFTTCQWKCYKCSLFLSVVNVDGIEDSFSRNSDSLSEDVFNLRDGAFHGISYCIDGWTRAVNWGCNNIPVEEVMNHNCTKSS